MKTTIRIFSYLKKYPFLVITFMSCSIISSLMVIFFPEIAQRIIDDAIPNKDSSKLIKLSILGLLAFFTLNLMNSLRLFFNNQLEQNVIYDMRSQLYQRIQSLPLFWFDNRRTGDIMTRVSEDVTNTERILIDGLEQGVNSILTITVVGSFLFYTNVKLALITIIPMPLILLGAFIYTTSAYKRHKKVRKATGNMNSILHDNIAGIRQIKTYSLNKSEHKRFNESSNLVKSATLNVMRYWAIYKPTMEFMNNLGLILILFFGGSLAIKGNLSIGELVKFLFYLALFYEPLTKIHMLNQLLQSSRAAAVRVFEIIDTKPEPNWEGKGKKIDSLKGNISYKNINFTFQTDKKSQKKLPHTLKNINLDIPHGQTIALVGHTGAGKSTLVNLLPRFYEYDSGSIEIDNIEIKKLSKTYLREIVSYVTQESFLFNGTIKENLLIAKKNASEDELWEVLKAANAYDFVKKLPYGLDTNVGERGVKLSVGEKQRVSIARAILKNAKILILDEATASVDNQTERLIQEALERLMQNRTSIVIAHRLSTIQNADCIYVIEDGEIIQTGTHKELIKHEGLYKKLISMGSTNIN